MPFGHPPNRPIPHEETPVNTAVSPGSIDLPIAGHAPHAESNALIKPGYDPALTNEDLAPLRKQTWGQYNIFAFWMSDVHSVGGYVTAGSLFALGLAAWQVLVALGLRTGDRGEFARPPAKPYTGLLHAFQVR